MKWNSTSREKKNHSTLSTKEGQPLSQVEVESYGKKKQCGRDSKKFSL